MSNGEQARTSNRRWGRATLIRISLALLASAFLTLAVMAAVHVSPLRPATNFDSVRSWASWRSVPAWALYGFAWIARSVPVRALYALAMIAWGAFGASWLRISEVHRRMMFIFWTLMSWLVQTRGFKYLVVLPFAYAFMTWATWKALTKPEALGDLKTNKMVAELRASLEQRVAGYSTNEQAAELNRALTWGTAGAALVLLTTVILVDHRTETAALAAACFALAIPMLIACGFAQSSHMDQTIQPPTVRETLRVLNTMVAAQFIVCIGVVALLWSYDSKVAAAFIVGCYLAVRFVTRALKGRTGMQKPTDAPVTSPPEVSQVEGSGAREKDRVA
jgi:hypothetical protein